METSWLSLILLDFRLTPVFAESGHGFPVCPGSPDSVGHRRGVPVDGPLWALRVEKGYGLICGRRDFLTGISTFRVLEPSPHPEGAAEASRTAPIPGRILLPSPPALLPAMRSLSQ